jgi:PAS domain S-box-containing protein
MQCADFEELTVDIDGSRSGGSHCEPTMARCSVGTAFFSISMTEESGGGPSGKRIQAPSNHRNGAQLALVIGARWRTNTTQSTGFGLYRSAIRGSPASGWTEFLHPDDLSETTKAFSHSIQTGTSYQAVHRLRRADGEYRWHHARGEPLRDRQGRVIQWYGFTVDIDEGKRAEDRLRRSEVYLAEAQRLSHTGSFGWTPSTGELHWSDETLRILEYDASTKPTIERVLKRIHPDDRAMMRRVLDETSRGEKDFDVTHRLLMPDGSVKFVHVLSRALKDAAGNLEIVGALMDVTENTRLYRDLAEREARVRRLIDSNIIGIFVWEAEGRILEANDAFLHMVGYDRKDVVSGEVRWTDLAPAEWRERDERALAERKSTGKLQPYEKEYFRKDGAVCPR